MKPSIALAVFLVLGGSNVPGQQPPDANQPAQRMPKTPEKGPAPTTPGEVPLPEDSPDDPANFEIVPSLKGLILVDALNKVVVEGAPETQGLAVRDVPILEGPEVQAMLAPYFGKPVRLKTVHRMEQLIILHCRRHDRPLVDVILPPQAVQNGVLQLVYLEGRLGRVEVENQGKEWFKSSFIRSQVQLQPGSSVDSQDLLNDMDWINRNPFREVNVLFRQGTNVGLTDLILKVEDRFPVRFYTGYENTGTEVTGEDRYFIGFNWGNAFGLDHQLNYQYTTDIDFDLLKAHAVSYDLPLPWRHIVTLFGSYVDAEADFGSAFTGTDSSGESYQASMRYSVPLPTINKKYHHQTGLGFDFKSSDNTLEFGPSSVSDSFIHILQLQAGYSGLLVDPWGQTSFGVEGYFSPGDLTSKNEDEDFELLRSDTKADYVYGRINAERVTKLPVDFTWVLRGSLQFANDRLMPSEELGVGGYRSVRGFLERQTNGDEGYTLSTEVRTPPWRLGNSLGVPNGMDMLQFLAFCDYGSAHIIDAQLDEDTNVVLASAGFGVRYAISQNLNFRFDYGWHLKDSDTVGKDSTAHLGLTVSF